MINLFQWKEEVRELAVNIFNDTSLFRRTDDLSGTENKTIKNTLYVSFLCWLSNSWMDESLQLSIAELRIYFMIHRSRTILIFQYNCQNMIAVLYFTWPAWTQGPPWELERYTFFYCEAHLLCMHFSHTGTPKHEHLPIIPTRRAERRADSKTVS